MTSWWSGGYQYRKYKQLSINYHAPIVFPLLV